MAVAASQRYGRSRSRRRRGIALPGRVLVRLIEAAVCLAVLVAGGYAFYVFADTSDYFRVKWIQVEGTEVLTQEAVAEASGVTSESNVIFLRSRAVRARIEQLPFVRTCRVSTVFPDTVRIHIEERQAVATVLLENRLFTVDRDGLVLSELALGDAQVGPLITSLPGAQAPEPGQPLNAPALADALAVWDAFTTTRASQDLELSELAAFHENDIRMYCENLPYELRWGRGDYAEQARRLDVLWEAKGGKLPCSQYLDLRFGRDLVCK